MFSIYTVADRVIERDIDYRDALDNFCRFVGSGGSVSVAVPIQDTDNTYEALSLWKETSHPFSKAADIFLFKYDNTKPDYESQMKNAAAREACGDLKLGLDFSHRIPFWQRERWIQLHDALLETDHESVMIPCVNLAKDYDHYKDVTLKWILHKKDIKLGIPNYAKLEDGSIEKGHEDGLDLINKEGNCPKAIFLCETATPQFLSKNNIPFIYNLSSITTSSESESLKHNLDLW